MMGHADGVQQGIGQHADGADGMTYRQTQRHEEVHEHLGQKRPVDHAAVAAELPQDAVARR